MQTNPDDMVDEDSHFWARSTTDVGVQECQRTGCMVRRAIPGSVWQRKKGGHWRSITHEAVPACEGRDPGDYCGLCKTDSGCRHT